MKTQHRFFAAVASRRLIRPAVRAIIRSDRGFLVQRSTDAPQGHYAFISGEYERGDTFHDRLRKEIEEETTARLVSAEYRFVVENRFLWRGELIQTLEHYFEATLDRDEVESSEPHLEQLWLSPEAFAQADVRPTVVRDAMDSGAWRHTRHLAVELT